MRFEAWERIRQSVFWMALKTAQRGALRVMKFACAGVRALRSIAHRLCVSILQNESIYSLIRPRGLDTPSAGVGAIAHIAT